jgi:hypothetical protein
MRRVVPIALVVVLLIGISSGCGGGGTSELTRQQAQDVVSKEAGEQFTCSAHVAGSDDSQVWWCDSASNDPSCWKISYDGGQDSWYTIDQRDDGDARVGVSQPGCPEYGETGIISTPPADSGDGADPDGPEGDLATIELGSPPSSDDTTLQLISSLLDTMELDCPSNTRSELADFTANTYEKLNGVASPSEILQDVSQSTELQAYSDCLDVFVQYVILRQGGG